MLENTYLFQFKESLERTNIQLAELKSVIELALSHNILFKPISIEEMSTHSVSSNDEILYCEFNKSCVIRSTLPFSLLHKIILRSSFITSCGILLYASISDMFSKEELTKKINNWLYKYEYRNIQISILEEAITLNTLDRSSIKRNKSREEKVKASHDYLKNIVSEWPWQGQKTTIEKDIDAQIWVYSDFISKGYIQAERSWDHSIINEHLYYLVFQPIYVERNALYELDSQVEAKPYWKGIDTTPQRLMGAMINISKVDPENFVIDPFSHTGSMALEIMKIEVKRVYYNDKFETLGTKDNIDFLTAKPEIIISIVEYISGLASAITINTKNILNEIISIAYNSVFWEENHTYPRIISIEKMMDHFPILTQLNNRLLYYLIRRYFIENKIGIYDIEKKIYHPEAFLRSLILYLDDRLKLLWKYGNSRKSIGSERINAGIIEIGYNPIFIDNCHSFPTGKDKNILEDGIPFDDNTIDCIITDPPYGYGSYNDNSDIVLLYDRLFMESIRVLKKDGRVSIATIDRVNIPTENPIDEEIKTNVIVKRINDIARNMGVKFICDELSIMLPIKDSFMVPHGYNNLQYWRTSRKLNRGILSFQIYKGVSD